MDLTFGTSLSQSGRLTQLTTSLGAGQLQAVRAGSVERIGRIPRYILDVLVQDTEFDQEKLIGQPVSLALLCDDGSQAPRHCLVESVRYLGSDRGLHDRPLIMGQVYGGHQPAWHSSGLMSGYKSEDISGGFNQWVTDDSTSQVRTQLYSSHGHAQFNLGYLIDQRDNHRGALRGTGYELRTDAYGALRAQQGLYLSTWKRGNAQGAQLTPVFAAPGPLQLLPNHLYGNGWLKVRWEKKNGPVLMSMPKANNPYDEIYSQTTAWWRLCDPRVVEPRAKNMLELQKDWYLYLKNLRKAQDFHITLGNYDFPETYAHFGADSKHPAWNEIDWILKPLSNMTGQFSPKISEQLASHLRLSTDNRINYLTLNNTQTAGKIGYQPVYGPAIVGADYAGDAYYAKMASQDDFGDSTVPTHSADAVSAHIKISAKLSGFEHSASYNYKSARAITLHSIISLARSAKNLC
nr:type VI secretion system Vgr family protein [Pseudomonas putida]